MGRKKETAPVDITEAKISEDGSLKVTPPSYSDITRWYGIKQDLARIKGVEFQLRARIADALFQNPIEGTNNFPLESLGDTFGSVLKMVHTVTREPDEALLATHKEELEKAGVPTNCIRWKPELKLSVYRTLSEKQRAILDKCLVFKDGSPQMDIVIPKRSS